jgi:alkylation response protein AidB-like acyl-CoA dehydrogenase
MEVHSESRRGARARAFAAREILGSVVEREAAARWDAALFRKLGEAGFLGEGMSFSDVAEAEALARALDGLGEGGRDAGLALAVTAHLAGAMAPIACLGSEAQRRRHLPPLARGEKLGAFAHVEPDATGPLRATRAPGGFMLDGVKAGVVNAPHAHLLVVTAVTDPAWGSGGMSAFLVERGARGVSVDARRAGRGLATVGIGDVVLSGCVVPEESLLGGRGAGRAAAKLARRWFRSLFHAPWMGLCRALLADTIAVAETEIRCGRRLAESPAARAVIADIAIRKTLCEGLLARATATIIEDNEADLAAAFLFLGEGVRWMTEAAAKLQGARGIEPGALAERLARDAAAAAIVCGSGEALRAEIASDLMGFAMSGGEGERPLEVSHAS